MTNQPQQKKDSKALWWGISIGAFFLLAALIGFLALTGTAKLTAEELARNWVEENLDAAGDEVATYLAGKHWALGELGEWVEDRIRDEITWTYKPERKVGGNITEVVATASVDFDVDLPVASGNVKASLPFVLEVDVDAQAVVGWRVDIMNASLTTTIPAVEDTIEAVQEATEEVKEAVEGKVKDVLGGLSNISGDGDCLQSAREAGVPDNVVELLEKPAAERGMMDRALVKTALEAAGLAEDCADLLE